MVNSHDLRNCLKDIISEDFLVDFISNSVSFDTVVVSKEDAQKILSGDFDSINPKLVSLVNNYIIAFLTAIKWAQEKEVLTENKLKDLHEIVVNGFTVGGLYRNVDISIQGSNHTPPSFLKVYDRMKKYFLELENSEDLYKTIAYSHLQLAKIHPFLDGNGRIARIVLNYFLVLNSLKPIYISYDKKNEYFDMLEEFKVNKNIEPFINYLKKSQN